MKLDFSPEDGQHRLTEISRHLKILCTQCTSKQEVRILPVDFVHRYLESAEYTLLHALRRCKGKNNLHVDEILVSGDKQLI